MYTILHLADLHRSPEEPVNNHSLVAALLADMDRYRGETPEIPSPEAIVVCGDLIQGARIGDSKWRNAITAQYQVARELLEDLTHRFLAGDRSRLIIVPGNHDVCWNTSFTAMQKVPEKDYPEDVYHALTASGSLYRWCWKDRALYRVTNSALYERRLEAYWDFVEDFYKDAPLNNHIDRTRPFQLFELDERRIVVAAYDSTARNDCFAYSGSISEGAVARCDMHLRDDLHAYKLHVAAWHHSIQGPPDHEDYMDVTHVNEMAGLGFQLGMHGHQHVAAATTHYVHLGESKSMAIVSSGSLCAGARELPRGINRQYNVVVINDDYLGARVHVREMVEGSQFARKRNGAFYLGYVDIAWQANKDVFGRALDADSCNVRQTIIAAEGALHRGDPQNALALLNGIKLENGSHARLIAMHAALKLQDWPLIITIIDSPHTTQEVVWLVTALTNVNKLDRATEVLRSCRDIDYATRRSLEGRIETQKALRPL